MTNPYASPQNEYSIIKDSEGQELASRSKRFFASLIDNVLTGGLVWAIILLGFSIKFTEVGKLDVGYKLTFALIGVLVFIGIQGYFLASNGQTLGKKILGIKIVTLKGGETRIRSVNPETLFASVGGCKYSDCWRIG